MKKEEIPQKSVESLDKEEPSQNTTINVLVLASYILNCVIPLTASTIKYILIAIFRLYPLFCQTILAELYLFPMGK